MAMVALILSLVFTQTPKISQVWAVRLQSEIQSYQVGERAIFFGTNDAYGAIDQVSGKKIWAKSVALPQLGVHVIEGDGKVFASVGLGKLTCLDAGAGKASWSLPRAGYASPIGYYNRTLYAELKSGTLSAISPEGKPLWNAALEKSTLSCRPIRYGKSIFAGTKAGSVYAFDKDTGKQVWGLKERKSAVQALLVAGEKLIATYDDGTVHGLSLEAGNRQWAEYTNNALFGQPLFKDGRLFIMCASGKFYCLAPENGQEVWVKGLSFRQNFGLTQAMPWRDGLPIADHAKLVHLDLVGEKKWEVDTGLEMFGNQPRPLGDDLLLISSHEFRRVRLNQD
jgi:outer membrane protein assembly factor BamB